MTPGIPQAASHRARFAARRDAPAQARRWVGQLLAGHPRLADAHLALSELINNVLEYGAIEPNDGVEVGLLQTDDAVRIIVRQPNSASLSAPAAFPSVVEERGRGLAIVEAVADRWGVNGTEGDFGIWFELLGPPHHVDD